MRLGGAMPCLHRWTPLPPQPTRTVVVSWSMTPPDLGGAGAAGGISLLVCLGFASHGWVGRAQKHHPPPPPQLAEDAGAQWVFATPFQFCHHLLLLSPSSFLLTLLPSFKDERTPTGSPVPCYPPSQRLGVLHPSIFVQRPACGPCSKGGEGVPEQREVALSHQMTSVRRMLEAVASLPSGLIQT